MRQAEKAPSFFGHIFEVDEAERFADYVEQIAMLTRRGVGELAGLAFGRIPQPHEHRAAGRVAHVADLPVIALATAGVEIMTAHRLGLSAETLRQIGSVETRHHAASRSEMRVNA